MPGHFGAAVNRKRGVHPGRANILSQLGALFPTPSIASIPTPPAATKDTKSPTTSTTSATTTPTTAAADNDLPDIVSSVLSSVLADSTTTSTSSSSTSTPSVPAPVTRSSIITSSPPKPSSTPTVASAVVKSVAASTQSQTPSAAAQTGSATSAVTLIGGIGGALAGTIFLTVIIAFFLRRWRKKRSAQDAFDASQFRRSATVLDEKDDTLPPRPPSMLERKNTSTPPAAYAHSDEPHAQFFPQHGVIPGQYRAVSPQHPSFTAGNQFGGAPMRYGANPYAIDLGQGDPGQGAPPIPGIHGPGVYAPYGVDPRSQRYPLSQPYWNQQQQQQQLYRATSVSSLPNPFSVGNTVEGSIMIPRESFLPPSPTSPAPAVSSNPPATTALFVTRQSPEALPAYSNEEGYTNVQRDVKKPLSKTLKVQNHTAAAAAGSLDMDTTTTTTKAVGSATTMTESDEKKPRPHTVYDADEVYGGM